MSLPIRLAAVAGIAVSLYALYVEYEVEKAKQSGGMYQAACDLASWASCSRVLSSSYGHILSHWNLVSHDSPLNLPNAATGLLFYVLSLLPPLFPGWEVLHLAASTAALAFSLFLAYVLRFVLKDFCLVCVTSYALNIVIFIFSARRWLKSSEQKSKTA